MNKEELLELLTPENIYVGVFILLCLMFFGLLFNVLHERKKNRLREWENNPRYIYHIYFWE